MEFPNSVVEETARAMHGRAPKRYPPDLASRAISEKAGISRPATEPAPPNAGRTETGPEGSGPDA